MKYNELIDPELRKEARTYPFNRFIVAAGNIYQDLAWRLEKTPEIIEEKKIETEGFRSLPLKTSVFSPAGIKEKMPSLIYVHGGAFTYKASVYQKKLCFIYAQNTGCKVFLPHYHLAPEYQYPAAYEDVLSLYRYVMAHTSEFDISEEKIGIAGDSAGASIAALVCNRWESESIQMPCLQMLMYPVTDAGMETESMKQYTDTPQWDSRANRRMWLYYCGEDEELRSAASPLRCSIPGKMPATYIETAQFDCLHDEGILYARKLSQAGVNVEINETEGTFHGYDAKTDAQVVRQSIDRRVSFLRKEFKRGG